MRDLKLKIELLPKGAWGNDFSKTLSKKDWDILKNECYKRANHKCAICGYKTDDLDAHEVWDFNTETRTQTLIDIVALCSKCHGVKHIRNSQRLGFGENTKKHFMKVNNCSELEFATHLFKAQIEFEERNKIYRWKMIANLEKFGGKGINFKQSYIPYILNPYTKESLEILSNDCSLLPRVKSLEINNYEGTINLICDRTNRIEWIGDEDLFQVKFNFGMTFKTQINVKNLNYKNIYFKLYGDYGEFVSKKFKLTENLKEN